MIIHLLYYHAIHSLTTEALGAPFSNDRSKYLISFCKKLLCTRVLYSTGARYTCEVIGIGTRGAKGVWPHTILKVCFVTPHYTCTG